MTVIDVQVAASADDGYVDTAGGYSKVTQEEHLGHASAGGGRNEHIFARWNIVSLPAGATIDSAYISLYPTAYSGTPPAHTIYFDDNGNSGAIADAADFNGRTKTTASVSWTIGETIDQWVNSPDIKTIIQELVDSYAPYSNEYMQVILIGGGVSGGNNNYPRHYDLAGNAYGAKLHIEYTAAVGGAIPPCRVIIV